MQKRKLKAIIFDMDGTLANTEEIHRLAFNEAFSEFSLPIHWSENLYARLLVVSGGRQRIQRFIRENKIDTKGHDVAELSIKVHKRKSEIYRNMLRDGHLSLRNGVERLIYEAADKGIRMGIATSSSAPMSIL